MLPSLDLDALAIPVSLIASILSVIISLKLHRLFSTGLSLWALIGAMAMMIYALCACVSVFYGEASAFAEISFVIAGFAAYAASRWLKGQFELVADHGN
jgi:hypothetical protein